MKVLLGWLVGIVVVLAIIFGLNLFGFAQYSFFAPRMEAVRRDTMIQSRAYSEASTRDIYRLKLQYVQAKTDDEKSTIAAFARHEATAFDKDRLPPDVQTWLNQIGG
jgi:hypothetical protein